MEYYPQSVGNVSKNTHIIPYLDSIGISEERLIYRPPISTITPSMMNAHGTGPQHKKVVSLDIPVISVQIEKGAFASNFHELRTRTGTNEEMELVVPPWVERHPTDDELASERIFRSKEREWEDSYWEEISKKLEELQRLKNAPTNAGDKCSDVTTVMSSPLSMKPGTSTDTGRDSFSRIVKSDSPVVRSTPSSLGGNGLSGSTSYIKPGDSNMLSLEATPISSNGGTAKFNAITRRTPNRNEGKGSESTASSQTSKYNVNKMMGVGTDLCSETDSMFTMHTTFSDDEILQMKMGRGGAGAPAPTSLFFSESGGGAADLNVGANSSAAPTKPLGKQVKSSPRQRELQQQRQKERQQHTQQHIPFEHTADNAHKSPENTYSRFNYVRATLPGALATGPFNNGTSPSNSSATGSSVSRCFQVDEGLNPFFWPPVTPKLEDWLMKALLKEDATWTKYDSSSMGATPDSDSDCPVEILVMKKESDDYDDNGHIGCDNEQSLFICMPDALSNRIECNSKGKTSVKGDRYKGRATPTSTVSPTRAFTSINGADDVNNVITWIPVSNTGKSIGLCCLENDPHPPVIKSRRNKVSKDSNKCCLVM